MGTGSKLLDTESAHNLIPNGGFSVKEADGNKYIYGSYANAAGKAADGNITLLHDYKEMKQSIPVLKVQLDLTVTHYTYTGKTAAINVNYPNVEFTVKNGKVVCYR